MANSRSNIYPVQLQGAELNLNKLDAEIKQYSGFNKNNSPFVGGCLSNIFTKDETIEGATSKNTYIAPNGDVYRVNTEGLWKNEELILDASNASFYNIEKVELAHADTIEAFWDETHYVYYIDNEQTNKRTFYFYFKELVTGTEYNKEILSNIDIAKLKQIQFSIFCISEGNTRYYGVAYEYLLTNGSSTTITRSVDKAVIYRFINNDELAEININDYDSADHGGAIREYYSELYFRFGTNRQYDNTGNTILVYLFLDCTEVPAPCVIWKYDKTTQTASWWQNASYTGSELFDSDLRGTILNGSHFLFTSVVVTENYNRGYGGKFRVRISPNATPPADIYVYDLIKPFAPPSRWTKLRIQDGTIENRDVFLSYENAAGQVKVRYINNDYQSEAISINANGNYENNFGLVDNCVLYNNGMKNAVCTPKGYVLITEWNTINKFFKPKLREYEYLGEDFTLIYTDFSLIFNTTKDYNFYKLKTSVPFLNVINGQIVINADMEFNSYRIADGKKLLYAPAWNNRMPFINKDNVFVDKQNTYLAASSINEYNLEDNASLILNPLPTINTFLSQTRENYSIKNIVKVNCYISAANSAEVLYKFSVKISKPDVAVYNDLSGLPFPANTDGNIQYSPSLFSTQKGQYGNLLFISEGGTAYKLMTYNNKAVMSYFLSTAVEGLQDFFTIQGQLYGILDNQIYNFSIVNEIANRGDFIVSVEGLQFVGNTPYEALFFSKTNRCLYSFTGANVLTQKQFIDKISEVRNYKYNPATQSIFLITDIGVIVYSLFGIYQIEFLNCQDMYLLNNGVILTDNEGTFKYVKYYKEETTEDYTKENITLETSFYGMNNQTVTINDCLYMRIFSEEHEEGDLEVSATTLSLKGRMTEKTTFKIKASDWDKVTHTIYLRYQPKEQRGLGISFSINSPFKIASLSIGSQADAILIDKVSKGAINAPQITSNNVEW